VRVGALVGDLDDAAGDVDPLVGVIRPGDGDGDARVAADVLRLDALRLGVDQDVVAFVVDPDGADLRGAVLVDGGEVSEGGRVEDLLVLVGEPGHA
jgi:hypothetical protein